MSITIKSSKRFSFNAFVGCLLLASLALIFSWVGLPFLSSNYYERSLNQLRSQTESLKQEFSEITQELASRQQALSQSQVPVSTQERFEFLKNLCPQPASQGFTYYDEYGDLQLWYGQIIDIRTIFGSIESETSFVEQKSSILIRHKSSVFLVSFQELGSGAYVVFYRLLAFLPQFKARYLKDFHLITEVMSESCDIDYQDFREDASGTESFFARHDDEYIGQPRLQDDILTLFFPLRNENGLLMATVTLRSLAPPAKLALQKENVILLFHLFSGLALVFLLISLTRFIYFKQDRDPWWSLVAVLILAALRGLFLTFSGLDKIKAWSAFAPTEASFLPAWNLTKSPADIFLTALFLFLTSCYFSLYLLKPPTKHRSNSSRTLPLLLYGSFLVISFGLVWILHNVLYLAVFHSRFHLLRLSPHLPYLLVQAGIFLFFTALLLLLFTGFRRLSPYLSGLRQAAVLFSPLFLAYVLIFHRKIDPIILILQGIVISLVWLTAYPPSLSNKKKYAFLTFFCMVSLVFFTVERGYSQKNRSLLQNSLKTTITAQQDWGRFLLQQSFLEIEKREDRIISLFLNPKNSNLASDLWRSTLPAKLNWNSSLEIISSDDLLLLAVCPQYS